MIDLTPLAHLAVWAIAITAALVAIIAVGVFVEAQTWWIIPTAVVLYMALRLTAFRD